MAVTVTSDSMPPPAATRHQIWAWCSFDWANSVFFSVILTFVFSAYFAKEVAVDEVTGTSQWAFAVSVSMAAVALCGPFLGAIADSSGRRKPWVLFFSILAFAATALLWFAKPETDYVLWTLACVIAANFAFEMGFVFYNAMLPGLVPQQMLGRVSGWGWGIGYAGGLICLVIALVVLIQPDPPLFGLDSAAAEPVRATALLVAGWFAVFSLPFFTMAPDLVTERRAPLAAVRDGFRTLAHTVRNVGHYRQIVLYLIARLFYTDALNTLFGIGGIYAAVTFNMSFQEILGFGIALNVSAGLGAFGFGWLDDRIGPKPTVLIALVAITVIGGCLVLVTSKTLFWMLAVPLGLFFGPAQSASRSLMARLTPKELSGEMFGLYALSGKATAFMGPAVFGWATAVSGSQRVGMATILIFFVIGTLLLLPVRVPDTPPAVAAGRREPAAALP